VLQGYNGVAAVDGKHQVVVAAEAYGQGQEHGLLEPMLDKVRENLSRGGEGDVLDGAKVLADSGYHSTKTLEHLETQGIDATSARPLDCDASHYAEKRRSTVSGS
jgi:hypothetical protein